MKKAAVKTRTGRRRAQLWIGLRGTGEPRSGTQGLEAVSENKLGFPGVFFVKAAVAAAVVVTVFLPGVLIHHVDNVTQFKIGFKIFVDLPLVCQCALQRDPPCARKSDPPLGVMCKDTKWGFNEGGKRGVA